jgi:hypothetical protein
LKKLAGIIASSSSNFSASPEAQLKIKALELEAKVWLA